MDKVIIMGDTLEILSFIAVEAQSTDLPEKKKTQLLIEALKEYGL